MTTYIAGPMTGYPNFNYPAFAYVATVLRAAGHEVLSPAEVDHDHDLFLALGGTSSDPWSYYMRIGFAKLLRCDEIVLLPDWKQSRGATLERHVAEALGMRITEWTGSTAHEPTQPQTPLALEERN